MVRIIIEKIKNNIPVIIPTDTIYGISMISNDENKKIINKIKGSNKNKELISLFSSFRQLSNIVKLDKKLIKAFRKNKRTTFIVETINGEKKSFRFVKGFAKKIIKKTGIIFSTSANISGVDYKEDINIFSALVGVDNVFFKKKLGNNNSKIIDYINHKDIR